MGRASSGWATYPAVGQDPGDVLGVIGKKPIHLMKKDEWVWFGLRIYGWILAVSNKAEAIELVRVGSVGVIDAPMYELPHGRVVARSLDNRIGSYTVLEGPRLLAQERPYATVAAVATTQEEISSSRGRL